MTYSMRDVPADLWRRLHAKAMREGRSLRYIILTLVELYCDGRIVLMPGPRTVVRPTSDQPTSGD